MKDYLNINGKKLYVEYFGNSTGEHILYIHGKPGIGVADFICFQQVLFEKKYYVIAPEQRGVLRSQGVSYDEFAFELIVEDYEEIRKKFGVDRWNIVCHSFGAYYAIKYYNAYPKRVKSIIFESPIFNMIESSKLVLKYQYNLISEIKPEKLKTIDADIRKIKTYADLGKTLSLAKGIIGDRANEYMLYPSTLEKINLLKTNVEIGKECFLKSYNTDNYFDKRVSEKRNSSPHNIYIECPCLILNGKEDRMIGGSAFNQICKYFVRLKRVDVNHAKHWIKIDNPTAYYSEIDDFIARAERDD